MFLVIKWHFIYFSILWLTYFFYNFSNPVQSVCTYSHRIVLAMKKEKGECVQGRGVNTTLFKVLISFSQMSDAESKPGFPLPLPT